MLSAPTSIASDAATIAPSCGSSTGSAASSDSTGAGSAASLLPHATATMAKDRARNRARDLTTDCFTARNLQPFPLNRRVEILLATSDFEQQCDGAVVGQVDFHFGLEDPCFNGGTCLPELSDHAIDQRFGMFWSCCADPTWPSTFAGIAVQRELADNEHLSRLPGRRSIGQRTVHHTVYVVEDPEPPELGSKTVSVIRRVVMSHPNKDTQTGPNRPRQLKRFIS